MQFNGQSVATRYNGYHKSWEVRFQYPSGLKGFASGFATAKSAKQHAIAQMSGKPAQKKTASHAPGLVHLYTDGSNRGQPGPGGWGAILIWNGQERELSGCICSATNNQAELMAVICGLEAITRPSEVKVWTDSQYVAKGINKWLSGWANGGWKKPAKNKALWQELYWLIKSHKRVIAKWVKGHSGIPGNERADKLAGERSKEELERQKTA